MADEVIQTPFGKFLCDPRDLIESTLKAGTLWDGPGFLQVIAREHARFGEDGTTILDVGANIGSFSIYCAHEGAWRVVAVEPVPSTVLRLKANLDLNQATCAGSVVLLEIAAYDRPAVLRLAAPIDPGNRGGAALRLAQGVEEAKGGITAKPLDDFRYLFGERVSLIKIDAQGCDGVAILGLEQTIRRDHPAVVFEWEPELADPHGESFPALKYTLNTWGYAVQQWPSHPDNYLATWSHA